MNVLVACEESQRVCIAFRKKGHAAYSCDLQECSGGHPEWHIKSDVLPLINGDCDFMTLDGEFHKQVGKWDLIIAHPPCTYFSKASAVRLYSRPGELNLERYNEGLKYKQFFLQILNADCEKICVENPTPLKIWNLPKPSCVIQPYEFGEPYSKRTCLWLKGLFYLMPTEIVVGNIRPWVNCKSNDHGCVRGSKLRSKTFYGIAKAMADQWG